MINEITSLIEAGGYVGVALLMLVETVFPPLPSEIIMPVAGAAAAEGRMSLPLTTLAGAGGSLAGATAWYAVARALGAARLKRWAARHGRWLTLTPEEVDASCGWFRRHCGKAVLFGRLVPTVRSLISLPAGFAGMGLAPFLAYSAVGAAAWSGLLAGAGFLLRDQHARVANWLDPVSAAVLAGLLLWYFYRVATFRRGAARRR